MLHGCRMPARELRSEEQNKNGRHDQQKKGEAIACKVAELLAKDGSNLRREQAKRVGLFGRAGSRTSDGASGGR